MENPFVLFGGGVVHTLKRYRVTSKVKNLPLKVRGHEQIADEIFQTLGQ